MNEWYRKILKWKIELVPCALKSSQLNARCGSWCWFENGNIFSAIGCDSRFQCPMVEVMAHEASMFWCGGRMTNFRDRTYIWGYFYIATVALMTDRANKWWFILIIVFRFGNVYFSQSVCSRCFFFKAGYWFARIGGWMRKGREKHNYLIGC